MRLVRRATLGLLSADLLIELGSYGLHEVAGPSGCYTEPDAQRVSGYRLLVSRTMSCVFSARELREHLACA